MANTPSGKSGRYLILSGTTDGHAKAARISRSLLRGIVESAFNIKPDDVSEAAQQKRNGWISATSTTCASSPAS